MSDHLRRRTASGAGDEGVPSAVLHALEHFQSRIHADPGDKPDAPPERDPATTDARTLSWHEIPAWQKDNEYVLTGYRRWVRRRRPPLRAASGAQLLTGVVR